MLSKFSLNNICLKKNSKCIMAIFVIVPSLAYCAMRFFKNIKTIKIK